MRLMDIEAIYPKPNTSKSTPGHRIYPYLLRDLLRGLVVERVNQVWSTDGTPEIFNSDQGSQFTSTAFTSVLLEHGVAISMDGRGRCLDNVFVERLWRSVKYVARFPQGGGLSESLQRWVGSVSRHWCLPAVF
jgi:putative transposase